MRVSHGSETQFPGKALQRLLWCFRIRKQTAFSFSFSWMALEEDAEVPDEVYLYATVEDTLEHDAPWDYHEM